MADIIQGAVGNLIPKFSMPSFQMGMKEMLWMGIFVEIIITFIFLYIVIYIWRNYTIRLIELEPMGKSYRARILWGKPIIENGVPKYQILGKKDEGSTFFKKVPLKIPAFPSDVKIPMKAILGYKELIIVHKDKNGDYRPFKALISKDQFDLTQYVGKEGQFNFNHFFEDLLPTLQIDNVKMRSWYKMKVNETLNIYKDPVQGLSKLIRPDLMMVLFIIFVVMIGAYMILK